MKRCVREIAEALGKDDSPVIFGEEPNMKPMKHGSQTAGAENTKVIP
jgi:hypothetical protein